MLKTLTDIIISLGLIDGKVSVMTADQLDEFARNIPDKKISCNVFGVGGYSRNDADVLTKTVRICLLKQMPVNYDLSIVDLAEAEMSTKLLAIMDALDNSPFINTENQTAITPELLTYDRTTLLVYLDVDLFGNTSVCGDDPCVPGFLKEYVDSKLEGYVSDPDYVHTDNNYTDEEKDKLAAYPVTPPDVYPYDLKINKQNCKWVDGWLWIDTGSKISSKKIDVGYMAISTGTGTEQLNPIVHYPATLTYQTSSIPNGFYLKDEDGRLSENVDFEFLDFRYNIIVDAIQKYDGLTRLEGGNAAFDDFDVSHSAAMRTIFLQIYEGFSGEVYRSATDELCGDLRIDAHFEPTYARIRNVDVIGIPIVNAGVIEQTGSNPDILKIASHYGNTFERRDITLNATTFINNVIAIGSCPDEKLPTIGTSYGFGVEFFEDTIKTSSEYPNFNYASWNPIYQQSATTAIITAKFRMIKDAVPTASWDIIRKAARMTAKKTIDGVFANYPGHWDMYRGFGIIHVEGAIQWIKDNYTENEDYLNNLADEVERTRGIDPMLPYDKLTNDTPVPKKYVPAIFWDEDNNTYSFEIPDGGMIQINQEPHDYYTNLQGAQIVNGDIVSVVGATGNKTAIALTDATNDAKALSCFGMVTVATIGNNNVGRITKTGGKVRGLNTAGYLEGTTIYVDPANPGKWTGVKPAAPLRAIQIGIVSVSHAVEGVVELFIKVYPKFSELADVDGTTTEVLDAETLPVKKVDGLIKFLSWSNIKATLKTHFDTLYTPKNTSMYKLVNDNTGYSHTGSVGYVTVKTINIPANTLKLDSVIWFDIVMSWTNNSNTKTFTIYLNNYAIFTAARGSSSMIHYYFPVRLKNGKALIPGAINDSSYILTGAVSTSSELIEVDFGGVSSNIAIDFKISLINSSDVAKYESINIIIEP